MITMAKDKIDYEQEWQTFLIKINDYAKDPPVKWTVLTLLSYFLVKYKEVNDMDFIFAPCKKSPTQSKEMRDSSKIWKMFDRDRYKQLVSKEDKLAYKEQLASILKEYIDWAFDVKFRGREVNVTGLGIFAIANFMNEFFQWRKAKKNALPKRGDLIPVALIDWAKLNAPSIWGKQQLRVLEDLNALYNYVNAYGQEQANIEHIVLEKARVMGIMPMQGKLQLDKK